LKVVTYILYFLSGLLAWLITFTVVYFLARGIVRFIALNITNSHTENIGCCIFEWDLKLQIATYSFYLIAFIAITTSLIKILKYSNSVKLNRSSVILFILSFPTYTTWRVNCEADLGGVDCGSDIYVHGIITPVIMSVNPASIIHEIITRLTVSLNPVPIIISAKTWTPID